MFQPTCHHYNKQSFRSHLNLQGGKFLLFIVPQVSPKTWSLGTMLNRHTFWNLVANPRKRCVFFQPFKPFSSQVHRSRKKQQSLQDLIAKSMARAVQMMERIERGDLVESHGMFFFTKSPSFTPEFCGVFHDPI